jgi:hypothetical protein
MATRAIRGSGARVAARDDQEAIPSRRPWHWIGLARHRELSLLHDWALHRADEPMNSTPDPRGAPSEFATEHREALDLRQADQDRTLAAIHILEAALSSAAPGREGAWRNDVVAALRDLGEATADEERNAAEPDSLLSDIARTQPRLRNRVRGLRAQYRQVRDTIATLQPELARGDAGLDVADVRQRLAWLLGSLRHQRGRESDLLYEAYYEAFDRDIERDKGRP